MPDPVAAHIYVTAKPRHLDGLEAGARTWWCIERSAPIGELGVVYVTGRQGFRFLFKFIGFSTTEYLCQEHGLATGEVEIIASLETPISAQTLRDHSVLRRLPALRRSFQRRSFRLEEPFLGELVKLIKQRATRPKRARRAPRT